MTSNDATRGLILNTTGPDISARKPVGSKSDSRTNERWGIW